MRVFDRGEWMIRAVIRKPDSGTALPAKSNPGNYLSPIGKWESVDYIQDIEFFEPGEKSFGGDLFLKNIKFSQSGKTSCSMMPKWRKDWVVSQNKRTKAKFIIKEIDGSLYLFLPWLSGDVILRGQKPLYYVLKKTGETG